MKDEDYDLSCAKADAAKADQQKINNELRRKQHLVAIAQEKAAFFAQTGLGDGELVNALRDAGFMASNETSRLLQADKIPPVEPVKIAHGGSVPAKKKNKRTK